MKYVPSNDPVEQFTARYDRDRSDLFGADTVSAPAFQGEEEFIRFAEADYQADRHWAFEIRPEECALIVVDLQQDFVKPGSPMFVPEAYRQIPRVKKLIEACREVGMPIFYTEHSIGSDTAADFYEYWNPIADGALTEGAANTKVYEGLDPQPGERIIDVKHTYDSFAGTNLDYALRDAGVKTVIICGTMTNFCCDSTARTAYFLHYHVVFGDDVCASDNAVVHEGTVRTLRRGFARVMNHRQIIDALLDGDTLHREARAAREASKQAAAAVA